MYHIEGYWCFDTYAMGLQQFPVKHKWFLKFDTNSHTDISLIKDHFVENLYNMLQTIHAISGCDTTSYFYRIWKIKMLRNIQKNQDSIELLVSLGKNVSLSKKDMEDVKEFINGKANESYIQRRVRIYNQLHQKSSLPIPSDPESLVQCIKRAHYQIF